MIIDIDKDSAGRTIFIPHIRVIYNTWSYDLIKLLKESGLDKNWSITDDVCIVFNKE